MWIICLLVLLFFPKLSTLAFICTFFYYLEGFVVRLRLNKQLCNMWDCMERYSIN